MKNRMHTVFSRILCTIFVVTIGLNAMPLQAAANIQQVKVGFFEFDGYHMIDEDGKKSGYGYEYLQQMAKYNDWIYEYVGYENSWSEMIEMLENGEIDMVTSAQKTPEREAKFDYSAEPIGSSATIVTVKAGNNKYLLGDYQNYNGIRIGMMEGNSRNESFAQFAKEKDFTYIPVYFNSTNDMMEALQTGVSIDAMVTSNLRAVKNEWVLAQFDPSPFYVIVKKGNTALLNQVNDAIEEIKLYQNTLQDNLFAKYYSLDNGEEIAYTAQERAYIEELAQSGTVLKAVINPDRMPLSYFEEDEARGILTKVSNEIMRRTGLTIELTETFSREDYSENVAKKYSDIILDARMDYNYAEEQGYKLTESYLKATISLLTKKDFNGTPQTIAVVKNADITDAYLKERYLPNQLFYYNSMEECLDAVKEGRQDAAYFYTYTTQKFLYDDIKNQFKENLIPDYTTEFCIGVRAEADKRLLTILSKAVESMNQEYAQTSILEETDYMQKEFSVLGYLYTNPMVAVGIIGVFFVLMITLILYFFSIRNRRLELEKSKEFERFISYVCKANDEVNEIDFVRQKSSLYEVKDGKVICSEKEFVPLEQFMDNIHPNDYEIIKKEINSETIYELSQKEGELTTECRIRNIKGDYLWHSYTFQGVRGDDNSLKIMAFSRNIHKTKKEEEEKKQALEDALEVARKASNAKGTFMSRMSHEIRTPLNAIIGYMSIADEEEDAKKAKNCITKAGLAARHLLNIINDILDISAIESGKMKIAKEDFDVKQLINTVTSIFYAQSKEKGVQLKVTLSSITEEWLVGDALRLNQILMNLLSNAIKFTPKEGTIQLNITQKEGENGKIYMTIQVADTGIGMSKDYMNRLFTPFEQQDASIAQKYGGTGLGLSITKNLVNMMNGTIQVASEEGLGTTFTVTIAFQKSEKTAKENREYDFSKITALIVDDEESDCEYMKEMLKRCGVKSDVVLSGEAAVKKLVKKASTNHPYDICLMDLNIPDLNGIEVTRKIREACGDTLPIIVATAYDFAGLEECAKDAGVNKMISKPVFQSTMFDILVNTYGKYRQKEDTTEEVDISTLRGMRLLLAEDNEMNLEIAISILEKAGLVVEAVQNGQEAVERFAQSEVGYYKAILMDIQMPIMNGYEATKQIRLLPHEEAQSIPIIAMTANAFAEDVAEALACGMNEHVAKPINYKSLFATLKKIV